MATTQEQRSNTGAQPAPAARPRTQKIKLIRPAGEEAEAQRVAVNGKHFILKYDTPTVVPIEVYAALKDAKTSSTRKNKDGYDEPIEVDRFIVVELD